MDPIALIVSATAKLKVQFQQEEQEIAQLPGQIDNLRKSG